MEAELSRISSLAQKDKVRFSFPLLIPHHLQLAHLAFSPLLTVNRLFCTPHKDYLYLVVLPPSRSRPFPLYRVGFRFPSNRSEASIARVCQSSRQG